MVVLAVAYACARSGAWDSHQEWRAPRRGRRAVTGGGAEVAFCVCVWFFACIAIPLQDSTVARRAAVLIALSGCGDATEYMVGGASDRSTSTIETMPSTVERPSSGVRRKLFGCLH